MQQQHEQHDFFGGGMGIPMFKTTGGGPRSDTGDQFFVPDTGDQLVLPPSVGATEPEVLGAYDLKASEPELDLLTWNPLLLGLSEIDPCAVHLTGAEADGCTVDCRHACVIGVV